MVLISRLIWLTDTPNRAGIIRVRIFTTPGWCQPHLGQTSMLSWRRKGYWNKNWTRPPRKTPIAREISGRSIKGAIHQAAAIMVMLRNTGVKEDTAKRPKVLRIAPAMAVKVMNQR